jgi:hypothetical protein
VVVVVDWALVPDEVLVRDEMLVLDGVLALSPGDVVVEGADVLCDVDVGSSFKREFDVVILDLFLQAFPSVVVLIAVDKVLSGHTVTSVVAVDVEVVRDVDVE